MIQNWCNDEQIQLPLSAVFNSLLPAIALALHNNTIRGEDGDIYVRMDFGDMKICKRTE